MRHGLAHSRRRERQNVRRAVDIDRRDRSHARLSGVANDYVGDATGPVRHWVCRRWFPTRVVDARGLVVEGGRGGVEKGWHPK